MRSSPAGCRFTRSIRRLALLNDGRAMVYGTMGGDGQPQTQASVFARYAVFGRSLQEAVSAPRWLLGRTWGQTSDTLKLESRFDPALIEALRKRGHDIESYCAVRRAGRACGRARAPRFGIDRRRIRPAQRRRRRGILAGFGGQARHGPKRGAWDAEVERRSIAAICAANDRASHGLRKCTSGVQRISLSPLRFAPR